MSKQFNVCAIFGERRSMKSAIMYAGRLAALLHAGELHIYLPGADGTQVAPSMTPGRAAELQRQRVKDLVSQWQPTPVVVHDDLDLATAHPSRLPENALVVSNELALRRRHLTVLQPFEETHVLRASGSILVPFGDGNSGIVAAAVALQLARTTHLDVVFYHTTWADESVQSEDPVDHLCQSAREHYHELQRMAIQANVGHSMAVEMVSDVVSGMLHCALNGSLSVEDPHPVNLIVAAHGVNTYSGSYLEEALNVSSTPILVVGNRNEEGGQS